MMSLSSEWVFSQSEVMLSDAVVGRGAFGEVRIGKWRSIHVACKRLHVFANSEDADSYHGSSNMESVTSEFVKEMALLSKLRHPNLVLFLGIVVKDFVPSGNDNSSSNSNSVIDVSTLQPQMILTELMTCSLYDILETYKISLTLPEVLDIAYDIICGLEYLHEHNPCIVHRDISSKNILIGGNRAKIADLGQAKLFETSVLSRQTGMPGAMAYAAPEVLTGKYSEKLDIFSFGVLVTQMCTGDYPRIDKRDEQLQKACNMQGSDGVLTSLLTRCCFYIPTERPSARDVSVEINDIMSNDRFYPPQRRVAPQSDISVLGRRWMEQHMMQQQQEQALKLEQQTTLLTIEANRWQAEHARALKAEQELAQLRERFMSSEVSISERCAEIETLHATIQSLHQQLQESKHHSDNLQAKIEQQQQTIQNNKAEAAMKDEVLSSTMVDVLTWTDKYAQLQQQHDDTTARLAEQVERNEDYKAQLKVFQEQSDELEERLERTLVGWRGEKDNTRKLQDNIKKMSTLNGNLNETIMNLEKEIETLKARLGEYTTLPLPDEIRHRFQDLEADLAHANKTIRHLTDAKHELEFNKSLADEKIVDLDSKLEVLHQENTAFKHEIGVFQTTKETLESEVNMVKSELVMTQMSLETSQHESERLKLVEIDLNKKIADLEQQAIIEAKRTQMLVAKAAQGAFELGLTPEVYEREQAKLREKKNKKKLKKQKQQNNQQKKREEGKEGEGEGSNHNGEEHEGAQEDGKEEDHEHEHEHDDDEEGGAEESKDVESSILEPDDEEYEEQDALARRQVRGAEDREGPPGLIALLKNNPMNPCICWRVCRSLRELVVREEAIRLLCLSVGVDDNLIAAILLFRRQPVTLAQAMRLLAALAYGNDLIRRKCGERGIVKATITALEEHADDESLLLHGCTLLTNLLHNSLENRHRFVECSGLPVLVGQMDRYRSSSKIQRQCCWCVLTLAGGSEEVARAVANETGAVSAVIAALTTHSEDAGVQQFGCWALCNMAIAGDDVRRRLRKSGAVEVCRIALERYGNGNGGSGNSSLDAEVIRQARNALGALGAAK